MKSIIKFINVLLIAITIRTVKKDNEIPKIAFGGTICALTVPHLMWIILYIGRSYPLTFIFAFLGMIIGMFLSLKLIQKFNFGSPKLSIYRVAFPMSNNFFIPILTLFFALILPIFLFAIVLRNISLHQ